MLVVIFARGSDSVSGSGGGSCSGSGASICSGSGSGSGGGSGSGRGGGGILLSLFCCRCVSSCLSCFSLLSPSSTSTCRRTGKRSSRPGVPSSRRLHLLQCTMLLLIRFSATDFYLLF